MKTFRVIYLPHGREDKEWMDVEAVSKEAAITETGLDRIANYVATNSAVDDVQLASGAKTDYGYLKSIKDKVNEKLGTTNSNGLSITGSYGGIRG